LIPTSALSLDTVNSIVVNGNAFPIPTDLNDAIDTMEWWGRRVSPMWEQMLLNLLMEDHFKNENSAPLLKHQHFAFVVILLQERIREQNVSTDDFNNTVFDCVDWFDSNWKPIHFYDLALGSLRWLHAVSPIAHRFSVAVRLAAPQLVSGVLVTPDRAPSCVSSAED